MALYFMQLFSMAIYGTQIFHKVLWQNVLRCSGIFNNHLNANLLAHVTHNHSTALWILSRFCPTQVSLYQKKHSPTYTYHGHQSSLICFFHLLLGNVKINNFEYQFKFDGVTAMSSYFPFLEHSVQITSLFIQLLLLILLSITFCLFNRLSFSQILHVRLGLLTTNLGDFQNRFL